MREEEIVIRYRMPSIPAYRDEVDKEMMEEAQRNFGGQIISLVMEHMDKNNVELIAVRKRTGIEVLADSLLNKRSGGISVPIPLK